MVKQELLEKLDECIGGSNDLPIAREQLQRVQASLESARQVLTEAEELSVEDHPHLAESLPEPQVETDVHTVEGDGVVKEGVEAPADGSPVDLGSPDEPVAEPVADDGQGDAPAADTPSY